MRGRTPAAVAVDLGALAVLLAVGVVGFGRVFAGVDHLVAGGLGVAAGLAVGALAARARWGLLTTTAATAAVYFLVGTAAAFRSAGLLGVIPSLESLVGLAAALVTSWKSLLTVEPPANGLAELLVVPFCAALVCAVVAATVALRAPRPVWALVPAAVLVLVSILFGTADAVAPLVQATAFGVVALAWAAWRRQSAQTSAAGGSGSVDPSAVRQLRLRRIGSGALVLALAAAVVGVSAGAVAPAGSRSTLREDIVPPFDLDDYPTPLASFRKTVRDQKDATLFTVSGLQEGVRVRLATMDAYTGTVFDVTGGGGGSGSFARVGSTIAGEHEGTPAVLRFTAADLGGVWLPDAGYPSSIEFAGPRAEALSESLHYNDETGVAVVTSRLAAGDSYTLTTTLPPVPSDEELADAVAAPVTVPTPIDVPEALADATLASVGEATTALGQVRAIETTLSTQGYFSHGLEGETESRPGHGSERLQLLLSDERGMVGDDEHYATTMALMVDELGLPARVVMGYYPAAGSDLSGDVAITGDDLHAWVEVAFAEHGWVAFDPTPPEEQILQDQQPEPAAQPKAQVLQPPPPPQEPAVVPPDVVQEDETEDDRGPDLGWIGVVLAVAGGVVGLAALLFGPALLIAALKRRRRRARASAERAADRISGGWDEVLDRAADLGTVVPAGATRLEDAALLHSEYPSAGVAVLARRADAAVFGPLDPVDAEVAAFWEQTDALVAELHDSVSPWRRWRARLSLRSLRPAWLTRATTAARGARTNTTGRPARNEDLHD
ncbi:transglutaminase-like domain-containing protein [Rathayibacter festucae]|uniref:transglutaminase-like domain-containing protein n=1 Tax=Rathayibacter festucae TaxID=110937 RepID=UPI002A69906E|nr:transglutaminase-like domain-containing protein [Rathayibacter festucae]MDY0915007.1 transglutaminase-like domain-containing protein [Rathayibacter festucae]